MDLVLGFVIVSGLALVIANALGWLPASHSWYFVGAGMMIGPLSPLLGDRVGPNVQMVLSMAGAFLSSVGALMAMSDVRRHLNRRNGAR